MKKYNIQVLLNKLNEQYVDISIQQEKGIDINQPQIVSDVYFKTGYLYSEVIKLGDPNITQTFNVLLYKINMMFDVEREKGIIEEQEK